MLQGAFPSYGRLTHGHGPRRKASSAGRFSVLASASRVSSPTEHAPGIYFKLASTFCNALEKAIVAASGGRNLDSHLFLKGNFGPVMDERFDQQLVVEGQLPAALDGAFLRTGPNPALPPNGGYHWFDGDGMVHIVRIKDGQASYCNRFVDTARLRQERAAGFPIFSKFGDLKGAWGVAHALLTILKERIGVYNPGKDGMGTGNTSLLYHANRVLALHEGDSPYALRVGLGGQVENLGRVTGYGGEWNHPFTAHPKIDPETGELFFFGYVMDREPYCSFGLADREGGLVRSFAVPIPEPVLMHDCAITKDYVIFFDTSLLFKPEMMMKEGSQPLWFDSSRPSRFGVMPRYAQDASQIRWFDTEPMVALHTGNAWQDGDLVKIYVIAFKKFSLDMDAMAERACAEDPDVMPYLTEVTLDLAAPSGSAAATRRVLDLPGDFPQVPPSLVGRKTRYTYLSIMATGSAVPAFTGIAKVDLQAADPSRAVVGMVGFGARCFGGETQFVPSRGADGAGEAGLEDAGYLVTFVHDEESGASDLVVYDAQTMSSKPVARVRMPRRVPYGLHGLWISEAQLQAQAQPAAAADGQAAEPAVQVNVA